MPNRKKRKGSVFSQKGGLTKKEKERFSETPSFGRKACLRKRDPELARPERTVALAKESRLFRG